MTSINCSVYRRSTRLVRTRVSLSLDQQQLQLLHLLQVLPSCTADRRQQTNNNNILIDTKQLMLLTQVGVIIQLVFMATSNLTSSIVHSTTSVLTATGINKTVQIAVNCTTFTLKTVIFPAQLTAQSDVQLHLLQKLQQ